MNATKDEASASRTQWLSDYRHPSADDLFSLPEAIHFLLKFRNDLAAFGYKSLKERMTLYFWWQAVGKANYPDFDWQLRQCDRDFASSLSVETLLSDYPECVAYWLRGAGPNSFDTAALLSALSQRVPMPGAAGLDLPAFLPLVVSSRPDLVGLHAGDFNAVLGALHWWEYHGKAEYVRINWSADEIYSALNAVDANEIEDGLTIPRFVPLLIDGRADLRGGFDHRTLAGRLSFALWWIQHGHREYTGVRWPINEGGQFLRWLRALPAVTVAGGAVTLPGFLAALREGRPDLCAAFDLSDRAASIALTTWWETSGRREYRPLRHLSLIDSDANTTEGDSGSAAPLTVRCHVEHFGAQTFGVNIVGFPQGMLGLGEDARTAAHALSLAAIPAVLLNAPMSGPPRIEHSYDHLLRDRLEYDVSLFCLPPPEMIRLALEGGKHLIEADTYRIGAWPWELPQWPNAFGRADLLVDEVWAQSAFVAKALSRHGDVKTVRMPMAVEVPTPQGTRDTRRARFGLPVAPFLFYLMFDGNSWLTRKNPMAGIEAFRRAFPASQSGVGLVIKAMNARADDPAWAALCAIAEQDPRIQVIDQRLSRQDTIDFMTSCDAYVSLHRSEGFGRIIAEAMALGQPVVVTNFSGNTDFCTSDTAYLVDGELVPLKAGDYLFHQGQYWCDPDVTQAAAQMQCVVEDDSRRARITAAGQRLITNDYSIEAVSRAYAARLDVIRQNGRGKE